jgi:hypothetical protein
MMDVIQRMVVADELQRGSDRFDQVILLNGSHVANNQVVRFSSQWTHPAMRIWQEACFYRWPGLDQASWRIGECC